jgi:glycosyltransferase involved in cell wall biosynthesis
MHPRLSVVIRSFNRLPELVVLVETMLAQRHDSFEVVVVEQSTERPAAAAARLALLEGDPRVKVLRSGPLGGPAARNAGVLHASGDILVFIDDDDLPDGPDFLALMEAPFREDPACMGSTCRHTWDGRDTISPRYRRAAARSCMRFSALLRLPYTYPRYDTQLRPVDYVHGSGGACRRSLLERAGGWDVDTPIEDETSMGIRAGRVLAAGEYLAFDPRARVLRRMDLPGGLGKRTLTAGGYYRRFMTFVHHIIGRYYPVRARALYPLYLGAGVIWTVDWIWSNSLAHDSAWKRTLGSVAFVLSSPLHALKLVTVAFGKRPGGGEPLAAELVTIREARRS